MKKLAIVAMMMSLGFGMSVANGDELSVIKSYNAFTKIEYQTIKQEAIKNGVKYTSMINPQGVFVENFVCGNDYKVISDFDKPVLKGVSELSKQASLAGRRGIELEDLRVFFIISCKIDLSSMFIIFP